MSASVVSCVDASPVLEAGEHVLDLVALAVEDGIVAGLDAVAGIGRDAGGDAALDQSLAEGGGGIGTVGQQEVGGWQLLEDSSGGPVVADLAFAEVQQQRASRLVADDLQLAGQAAPGASDTSG